LIVDLYRYENSSMPAGEITAGRRFGRLEVEGEGEPYLWQGRIAHRRWVCTCDCGRETLVRDDVLKSGHTRSCGCLHDDRARERWLRHGVRAEGRLPTAEYNAWQGMRRRYGDAAVCRRWRAGGGKGFAAFLADMGARPSPAHRLVRRDPARGFSPGNCLWSADAPRQGVPRRFVRYRGRSLPLKQAAIAAGIGYERLCKRLQRGWPEREALRR
jgi:hypothetical protein